VDQVKMLQIDVAEVSKERDMLLRQQEQPQQQNKHVMNHEAQELVDDGNDAAEKTRLIDQIEMLQQDMSEVVKERNQLNDALQEFTAKGSTTEAEASASAEASSIEILTLKGKIGALEQELIVKDNQIEQLNDQIISACTLAVDQAASKVTPRRRAR